MNKELNFLAIFFEEIPRCYFVESFDPGFLCLDVTRFETFKASLLAILELHKGCVFVESERVSTPAVSANLPYEKFDHAFYLSRAFYKPFLAKLDEGAQLNFSNLLKIL